MRNVLIRRVRLTAAVLAFMLPLASVFAGTGAVAQQYPSLQGAVFNGATPQQALQVCASRGFGNDWHNVAPEIAQSLTDRRYMAPVPPSVNTAGWSPSDFYAYYRAHGGFGDTAFDCIPAARAIGFHQDGTPPPPGIAPPTPTPLPTPGYPSSNLQQEAAICAAAHQRLARLDPNWVTIVNSQMNAVVPQTTLRAQVGPGTSGAVRNLAAALLNFEQTQAYWLQGEPQFNAPNGTYFCDGWAATQRSSGYGLTFPTYQHETELLAQLDATVKAWSPAWQAYEAQQRAAQQRAAQQPAPAAPGRPPVAMTPPRPPAFGAPAPGVNNNAYSHTCVPSHPVPAGWMKNCIDTNGFFIADDAAHVYWVVAPGHVTLNGNGSLTFFGRTVSAGTLVFPNGYYFAVPVRAVTAAAVASGNLGPVDKIVAAGKTYYVQQSLVHYVMSADPRRRGIDRTKFAIQTTTGQTYVIGIQGTANVIAAGGANVIAAGGANVIAAGGANVIAAGGANAISAASNLQSLYAAGVIAAGGAN